MRKSFLLMLITTLVIGVGCKTVDATAKSKSLQEQSVLFAAAPAFDQSRSFNHLLKLDPGHPEYESTTIDYLLERMADSGYTFIRNDELHTSKRAMLHLRWKYWRNKKNVTTAKDFIEKVATRSKMSGKLYLVKKENEWVYPTRKVLYNELSLLEEQLLLRAEAEDAIASKTADTQLISPDAVAS